MGLLKRKKVEEGSDVDDYIKEKLKKFPKKQRKQLIKLYKEYKKGNMIFPEGFEKDNFLNKE